jgi:hypothetical protein
VTIQGKYALLAVIAAGVAMGLIVAGLASHIPAGF